MQKKQNALLLPASARFDAEFDWQRLISLRRQTDSAALVACELVE